MTQCVSLLNGANPSQLPKVVFVQISGHDAAHNPRRVLLVKRHLPAAPVLCGMLQHAATGTASARDDLIRTFLSCPTIPKSSLIDTDWPKRNSNVVLS